MDACNPKTWKTEAEGSSITVWVALYSDTLSQNNSLQIMKKNRQNIHLKNHKAIPLNHTIWLRV